MSGDVWSYIGGLREDLGRAEERIRELEARHETVRTAGLADEAYLAVGEELAELLGELADAIEGKPCPCGEGKVGDCPGAWRGCDYHDEEAAPPACEDLGCVPGGPHFCGPGGDQ